MGASRHMLAAAAIIAALLLLPASRASEGSGADARPTRPEAPQAATEESPFGGPPPMKRGKKNSVNCKTDQQACTIKPSQPVGTPCSCPNPVGGTAKGTVID